ncbi:MAG TPA: PxKF domain-containing protein [Pyrinomonadaceae bacterium]|nr:PxKF domain-containing protein [Pyrinomonadaceae bacterium]
MKIVTSPRRVEPRSSHRRGKFHWLPFSLTLITAMLVGVVAASACTFILTFGTVGSDDGQFITPRGIALDPAGNVYVADGSGDTRGQIQKFDADGNFLARLGQNNGTAQGFLTAHRITTDSSGNVYATDGAVESASNVVKKFDSSGVFQFAFGATVSAGGQFQAAGGIAVDSLGNIYVADLGANVVRKFSSTGTPTGTIGSSGSGDGQFSSPVGIAIDSANNLYVADTGNNRIQKLTTGGTFLTKWGTSGTANGEFSGPKGVAVDSVGTVYVADTGNNRVQLFSSSGTFIEVCGSAGSGDGQFQGPDDVASNAAGTFFYVADTNNSRIQKFSTAATSPTANAGADQTVECAGATTAVNLDGSASTAGSGTINSYSWAEGATPLGTGAMLTVNLPVGVHTITLTVTDTGGGSDTDDVVITVQDTLAPNISCPADVVVNLPMNSTATSMVVNYPAVTATDSCSSSVTVNSTPASGSVFPVGTTTVNATADDGAGHTSECSFTVTVQYNFAGFFPPIANLPAVNIVNAGRAIPVKFSLGGNKGLGIFAAGSPASGPYPCNSSDPATLLEETVTAGGSSLSYDPTTDQYIYVWKTEKGWAGTCRQLVVQLNDGSIHRANFQFK